MLDIFDYYFLRRTIMKKFSKIILILLAVALLCGIAVTFVSADTPEDERAQLNVTGSDLNVYNSMKDSTLGGNLGYGIKTTYNSPLKNVKHGFATKNNNGYFRYSTETNPTASGTNYQLIWSIGTYSPTGGNGTIFNYNNQMEFLTVDVDFGTDSYAYKLNDVYYTAPSLSAIPDGATDVGLAYLDGYNAFMLQFRNNSNGAERRYGAVYTVKNAEDGLWYLSTDKTYSEGDALLSNKVDVLDHFTYVVKFDYDNAGGALTTTATMYMYVNGQYFAEASIFSVGDTHWTLVGLETAHDASKLTADNYAFVLDNLAANYYDDTQNEKATSELAAYLEGEYKTKPLFALDNVVYSADYKSPNGYVDVNGKTSSIPAVYNGYIQSMKNGATITSSVDIIDLTVPDGIKKFYIELLAGAKFELSEASKQEYITETLSATSYLVREIGPSDCVNVEWIYTGSGTEEVVKKDVLYYGKDFVYPANGLPYFSEANGAIYQDRYVDWTFDIDGDYPEINLYNPESPRKLTPLEMVLIHEEMGGVLKIYSDEIENVTLSTLEYAVGTLDSKGNFEPIDLFDDDFASYSDFDTIKEAFALAPSDAVVRLYYTGTRDIGDITPIEVAAGKTLSIDLNGRVLLDALTSSEGVTSSSYHTFKLNENSTFNLFSSKSGGAFYQAKMANSAVVSPAIVYLNDLDEATVNFGDIYVGDKLVYNCADDFAVYGAIIHSAGTDKNKDDGVSTIDVNINGGTYQLITNSSQGMFVIYSADVCINIKNAALLNSSDQPMIYEKTSTPGGSELNVYNSQIVCRKADNSDYTKLYQVVATGTVAHFENSTLVGEVPSDMRRSFYGKITFGAGCQIDINGQKEVKNKIVIADGVTKLVPSEAKFALKLNLPKLSSALNADPATLIPNGSNYSFNTELLDKTNWSDLTVDTAVQFITVSDTMGEVPAWEVNTPAYIAVIKWITDDGKVHGTTYTIDGAEITPYALAGVVGNASESDWFGFTGYTKWNNTTEGKEASDLTAVAGKVNTFVAAEPTALVAAADAKINMSYWSHFSINLHLPKEEGIVFDVTGADGKTGFYTTEGVLITENVGTTSVVYQDAALDTYYLKHLTDSDSFGDYSVVAKFIAGYDFDGNGTVEEGEKFLLEQTFVLNDLEYAVKVAEAYDCGSPELKLITAYLNYKRSVYEALGEGRVEALSPEAEALFEAFADKLASHGASCTCVASYDDVEELFTEDEKAVTSDSYADLAAGDVLAISYVLDVKRPTISIYVKEGVDAQISIKYLELVLGTQSTHAVVSAPVSAELAGQACLRYDITDIAAENINSVFEITVETDSDSYTGKYCLAEYIENYSDFELAKVYYAYANACQTYAKFIKDNYEVSDYGVVVDN